MKSEKKGIFLMALIAVMLLSAFSVAVVTPVMASTYVNGSITEDTTWTKAKSPYVVDSDVIVEEGVTLTIQPGVVVKFESYWDSINVKGTLIGDGTPTDKIVFTSLKDDEYGGDTNNDGDASAPGKENWTCIRFEYTSKNSILDNVILKYAGGGYSNHGIWINSTDVPITNSIISDISGNGIYLKNSSPTITGNTINNTRDGIYCRDLSNPIVSNNAFTNNNWAVHLHEDCYAVLSGNTVSGNDYNGVRVEGTLSSSGTWYTDIPYIVSGDVTVEEGVTLTIQPGVVVKFESYWDSINVKGTLIADGTPTDKIIFTSLKDDEYGGDTNNDGDASAPGKENWKCIRFEYTSKNSILDNVILKYAGGGYANRGIWINSTDVPITNSIISDIGGNGIYMINSSSTITGNTINNTRDGIYCRDLSNPIINYNSICGNSNYGVNNDDSSLTINAKNNWWGHASGPLDDSDDRDTGGSYNPDGKGDKVSDYVKYEPWLTSKPTPTPTPTISTVSFNPTKVNIPLNSMNTINLILNKAPNGLSEHNITISLSSASVAGITSVGFPSWATQHSNSTLPADTFWMKAADLDNQVTSGATNVELATLTLRGDNQGTSDILITVTKMDDDNGYPIEPSTVPGHLEVGKTGYSDTDSGTYPSLSGTHTGTITPSQTISVSKLYTYPCPGTGGHTEYVRIYGNMVDVSKTWSGYAGDYHNITFDTQFNVGSRRNIQLRHTHRLLSADNTCNQ